MKRPGRPKGRARAERIDLGLAVLSAIRIPHRCYTAREIAAFADCTHQNISRIERSALAKIRRHFARSTDPDLSRLALQALGQPPTS